MGRAIGDVLRCSHPLSPGYCRTRSQIAVALRIVSRPLGQGREVSMGWPAEDVVNVLDRPASCGDFLGDAVLYSMLAAICGMLTEKSPARDVFTNQAHRSILLGGHAVACVEGVLHA
jgi:hypothetical protein